MSAHLPGRPGMSWRSFHNIRTTRTDSKSDVIECCTPAYIDLHRLVALYINPSSCSQSSRHHRHVVTSQLLNHAPVPPPGQQHKLREYPSTRIPASICFNPHFISTHWHRFVPIIVRFNLSSQSLTPLSAAERSPEINLRGLVGVNTPHNNGVMWRSPPTKRCSDIAIANRKH